MPAIFDTTASVIVVRPCWVTSAVSELDDPALELCVPAISLVFSVTETFLSIGSCSTHTLRRASYPKPHAENQLNPRCRHARDLGREQASSAWSVAGFSACAPGSLRATSPDGRRGRSNWSTAGRLFPSEHWRSLSNSGPGRFSQCSRACP